MTLYIAIGFALVAAAIAGIHFYAAYKDWQGHKQQGPDNIKIRRRA